jgi:hypothetical protein
LPRLPHIYAFDDDGRRHAGGAHGHQAALEVAALQFVENVPIKMEPVAPMG